MTEVQSPWHALEQQGGPSPLIRMRFRHQGPTKIPLSLKMRKCAQKIVYVQTS